MILAGDVGGTKTALALFERADVGLREVRDRTFSSRKYASLEVIVVRPETSLRFRRSLAP